MNPMENGAPLVNTLLFDELRVSVSSFMRLGNFAWESHNPRSMKLLLLSEQCFSFYSY